MSGNHSRRKGYGFERAFVNYMREGDVSCRRVPLSGAGEEKGDVTISVCWSDAPLRGELKRRKELPAWLTSALGDHHFVALREDRGETLVLMRVSFFRDLLQ